MKNTWLIIIITFIVIIGVTTFGIFKFEHKEEVVPENPSLKDQKRYEGTYICMKRLAKEASVKEVRIEHTIIDDEHAREFIVHQYTAYIREEGERLVEIQNELLGLDYECTNYDQNPLLVCKKNNDLNVGPDYVEQLENVGYSCQKK